MVRDSIGLRHFFEKEKIKKYFLKNTLRKNIDKIIYIVGVAGPLMTFPQLIKILVDKTSAGVSSLSWSAYFVLAIFWIIYGVVHKNKPIILTNVLWAVLDISVVIGAIVYG